LSKPPLIAIVDDDEAVREALFDFLQVEGLRARTFANAASFLADTIHDFDCVITDVRMPDINGLELQQRLRERGSAMAMIFITASVSEATRATAMRCGATAWFSKPVANSQLLEVLRSTIAGSRDAGGGVLPES
jgi:FixJ family two-component response regulator